MCAGKSWLSRPDTAVPGKVYLLARVALALASVAQLAGRRLVHQEVDGSIPGQGHMPKLQA